MMNTRTVTVACLAGITALMLKANTFEPLKYWCRGGNVALEDAFALEGQGSSYCKWVDGNIFCTVGSTTYLPQSLITSVKLKTDGNLTYDGTEPLRMHGFSMHTGWRIFSGNGKIEIGAGGIAQHPSAWDGYCITVKGGLRLTASQTWSLRNGLAFSDYNPANANNTASVCPVEAAQDVVLTITTTNNSSWNKYTGVKFYGPNNDFSGADIVLRSQWLHLADANAKINAKSITLDGSSDAFRTRIYAEKMRQPVVNSDFSTHFILKGGAQLKLYSGCFRLRDEDPNLYFNDVTYDLQKLTIATGTSPFGDG